VLLTLITLRESKSGSMGERTAEERGRSRGRLVVVNDVDTVLMLDVLAGIDVEEEVGEGGTTKACCILRRLIRSHLGHGPWCTAMHET
jgi:hypothetical protein